MGIKIILSILCAVILLTGCGGDKADEPVIATMKVSESNLDFTSAGGNAEVELTANCDWVIHEKPDWVSVTPNKGNGDATLKIRVSSNNEYNNSIFGFKIKINSLGFESNSNINNIVTQSCYLQFKLFAVRMRLC